MSTRNDPSLPFRARGLASRRRSRREFLSTSAAAAGALAIGSSSCSSGSFGRRRDEPLPEAPPAQKVAAGEPVRIGVIGTGGMGTNHVSRLLLNGDEGRENLEVVALSDVCLPRLENALAKARDGRETQVEGYRDYHELLARDDIHGVLIASPEHWHANMAIDAIGSGKDVYLEKPMTLRLHDALRLKELMELNPHMRLQVGTQYMMLGKYQAARRLIAEGAIGHPTFSQTSYCRNSIDGEWLYTIDPQVVPGEMLDWDAWCGPLGVRAFDTEIYHRWRRYRDFSTGIVGDLLVHMMTPMIYALDPGWPVRVTATGGHYVDKAMQNHDQVNITVQFEREQTLVVAGSTCNEQGLETMIRGHEANIYLGSNNCVLRPERPFADDVDTQTIECAEVESQDELRLDWLRSIRTREPNASPVELGTQVMVIVDLATRSMWEGSAFTFDPETLTASRA